MSVNTTVSFDDAVTRAVYDYVERNGAATLDDLAREVEVEDGPPASKPTRSGTYVEQVPPSPERIESAVADLTDDGYLVERDGAYRVALSPEPTEVALDDGRVRLRPAREADRDSLVETMRSVASDGPHVVAEDVAAKIERSPAVVRVNGEGSRVFFVAVDATQGDGSNAGTGEVDESGPAPESADVDASSDAPSTGEVVGWLHLDVPDLEPLEHTASLTVGVREPERRRGIATELLDFGLEWAESAGLRKLCQRVPATNERAIDFLEATGWEREGERTAQYHLDGDFVDEVQFAIWPGERPS